MADQNTPAPADLVEALPCPFCGKDVEAVTAPNITAPMIHHPPYDRHCPMADRFYVTSTWNRRAAAITPQPDPRDAEIKRLREAGAQVIGRMLSTYKARNGREVGIEADDGEKCYIVHSDDIEALRAALAKSEGR